MIRLLPVFGLVLLFATGWWGDIGGAAATVLRLDAQAAADPQPAPPSATSDSSASWDPYG